MPAEKCTKKPQSMKKQSLCETMPAENRSTRISCDRCYTQKLKCLRMTGEGPCKRCSRAGVQCTSSPAKRMGRPVRANKVSITKREITAKTTRQIGVATPKKQPEIPEKDNFIPFSDPTIHPFEPARLETNIPDLFIFCDTNNTTPQLGLNEWPTPTSLPSESFHYQDLGMEDWGLESYLSCHSQVGSYSQESIITSAPTPESIDGAFTNPPRSMSEPSLYGTPPAIDPGAIDLGYFHGLPQQDSGDHCMEKNIAQLSLLNTRVYRILRRMKTGPWNDVPSGLESPRSSNGASSHGTSNHGSTSETELFPVGEILETSQLFLDLLRACAPSIFTALDTVEPSQTTSQDLPMLGLDLDAPTVIDMLTCFIRLRRIYHGLFAYIRQSLISCSGRQFLDTTTLPYTLTGRGAFSLPESWNLQLIALVQISDRLLQTMECVLGIPNQEHKPAGNPRFGIIAQHAASAELMGIWTRMEALDNMEHFEGAPSSLRDDIKEVKNTLKNSLCL